MNHKQYSMEMRKKDAGRRDSIKYATGFSDNLQPLESLDLGKVKGFDELAKAMSKTAFLRRLFKS